MADIKHLRPFILKWEGGLSRDANDTASRVKCPTPYKGKTGYHTNKGITYAVWRSVFGSDKDMRFLEINDADWDIVIKRLFWDRWKADEIKDQAVANTLVDWVWGSGVYGIKIPQRMLNVTADGVVGAKTIEALNNAPKDFLQRLYKEREDFLHRIVRSNPTQKVFLKGWMNRMADLRKWNEKFAK